MPKHERASREHAIESYANRMDREVDEVARGRKRLWRPRGERETLSSQVAKIAAEPAPRVPLQLAKPAQQVLLQLLLDHLQALPPLGPGERPWSKPEYSYLTAVVGGLYTWCDPRDPSQGTRTLEDIPKSDCTMMDWLVRNCGGVE